MTATMLPPPDALTPVTPTDRIRADARPTREYRAELRRVPTVRNVVALVSVYAQAIGIIAVAVWLDHPVSWVLAFLLLGRTFAQLLSLMHEAAHRMLFRNRTVNDFVGRWIVGYPAFAPTDLYRRGHAAHHREEFGPDEPDLALYRGYPITRASLRRKLWRDATGQTGWKLLRGLFAGVRSSRPEVRREATSILAMQAVVLALFWTAGHPWLYLFLWFAPYMTVWRVINRLRAIAEHGGMQASPDRRNTTHAVRQSWLARFWIVPYNIGLHLPHHADSGIPWAHLPEYHRELVRAGYIGPDLEHPSYRALWRALSSG